MGSGKNNRVDLVSLFIRIVIILMVLWVTILGITITLTMNYSIERMQQKIESYLMSTAVSLAQSDMVHEALEQGECSQSLMAYLDNLIANTSDMDIITITDAEGIRLYHVVHDRIGEKIVGGDEGRALQGESYFSDAVGTLGQQHRAFTPVYDSDGQTVIGLVLCSAKAESMNALKQEIEKHFRNIAILLLIVTLFISSLFTLMFNYSLKGYSPEWLVRSYLLQNDLINNLEEGIILTDEKGTVQFVSKSAAYMLGTSEDALSFKSVDDFIQRENGKSLIQETHGEVGTNRPNILCRTSAREKKDGYILLLKDRTEAVRRAQQLAGTSHIISALRANTHEFMNKLQVIGGLLQMKQYDQASDYINSIASVQTKAISPVLQHIHNPNVAALLLGKLGNMRELEINMTLLTNSTLPEHSAFLSTTDLVTLIGNILENAMEAINAKPNGDTREIVLQITESTETLLIMVSDTGVGISPEDMPHIYETGFSTKSADGRGIGMGLVKQIVQRRKGNLEIDSEPGVGTTVTAIFNVLRDNARRK